MLWRTAEIQRNRAAALPRTIHSSRLVDGVLGGCRVEVGHDDVRAAPGELQDHVPADSAAAADDQGDLPAEFTLGRHPLELGLLERPVLDAERLAPRQRDVIVEAREESGLFGMLRLRQASAGVPVPSSALAPAMTWIALMKNSVVIRASRLSFAKPNRPSPGITTTDGFESRSAGELASANDS